MGIILDREIVMNFTKKNVLKEIESMQESIRIKMIFESPMLRYKITQIIKEFELQIEKMTNAESENNDKLSKEEIDFWNDVYPESVNTEEVK